MGKLTKVVGLAGAAAGAVYLSKSENREKVKSQLNKAMKSLNSAYVKDLGSQQGQMTPKWSMKAL